MNSSTLTLRPISQADYPFLLTLYGSTRAAELIQTGWDEALKQQFITMQFEAQHRHYQNHYPAASFDLILHEDTAIGRLYLEEWAGTVAGDRHCIAAGVLQLRDWLVVFVAGDVAGSYNS